MGNFIFGFSVYFSNTNVNTGENTSFRGKNRRFLEICVIFFSKNATKKFNSINGFQNLVAFFVFFKKNSPQP